MLRLIKPAAEATRSLAPRFSLLALLLAAPLGAQSVSPQVDSLVARTLRGDNAARDKLGSIARGMVTDAEMHRLDAPTARATAQVAIAMATPMSPPNSLFTTRDMQWRGGATRALRQALNADSGDLWSATQLERISPYPYLWWDVQKELAIFRALHRRHPDLTGELAATRIRLELEAGTVDSAARAFDGLPATGLSVAERKEVEAEIRFAQGRDAEGRSAYFAGVAAIADSTDAAWYLRSISSIAKPDERDAWNALGYLPGARTTWVETFWAKRDLEDARTLGTRLPEHYRRWRVALQKYRWDVSGSMAEALPIPRSTDIVVEAGWDDILFPHDPAVAPIAYVNRFHALSRVVDDRGLMVLKLGEPISTVGSAGVHELEGSNLEWAGPQGPFVIGFSRAASFPGDLRWGMVARNQPIGDIMSVCQIDQRLCMLAGYTVLPPSIALANRSNKIRVDMTETRVRAEAMDGNPESFAHALGAMIQAYGIPRGGTLVVVGVPVRGLVPDESALTAMRAFATRVRVVVGDTTKGRVLSSLDTLRRWQTGAAVGKDAYLNAYFIVPAPVGDWSVSVVVGDTTHRAGSGQRFRSIPVARFDGKSLELSDPILGRAGSGLSWNHDGEMIPLNPTNAWRREESVILSYELDGMVTGHSYQTRYELWKVNGKPKKPALVISANAVASSPHITMRRELALKQLAADDYRLVVRVTDATTGAEVVRERRMAVRQ